MKRFNIQALVYAGVFFISLSSILIRLSDAPSLVIAFWRMAFSVLFLLPFVIKKIPAEARKIKKEDLMLCLASGLILAVHFAAWITSIEYTSVSSATVIVTMHPLLVVTAGFFILGEKITARSLFFIIMALAGSALLAMGDSRAGGTHLYGDLLAGAGMLTFAAYLVIGRAVRQRVSAGLYTIIVYTTCTLLLLLVNTAAGIPLLPYSAREFLIFISMAFFCTILGHSIFNWALRYLEPVFVSTSILGEPVFASIMAVFIFREIPGGLNLAGGALVITGIFLFMGNGTARGDGKRKISGSHFHGEKN